MILLVSGAQPRSERLAARFPGHIGRLLTPREWSGLDALRESGLPWAADNDAFSGFDEPSWLRMLAGIASTPGCLFVTAPDVVGDAVATDALWALWRPRIAARSLPAAYVLQDGLRGPGDVPWDADAVFVGGTTEFKMSDVVVAIVAEARRRGRWAHMGRVNTARRIRFAGSVGCDSIDGSKWSRFTDAWAHQLAALPYRQGTLS